jgi:branched-chain amino acid transport system substrate-binding protein
MQPLLKSALRASGFALGLAAGPALAAVKIGMMVTVSGPGAALGVDQRDGFMLALEQNGGKLGGQEIQLIIEDDQFKPDLGVQIARKFVDVDKVDFVTGITYSNVMMAAHKPIVDSKTFLIGSNAGPSPLAGAMCSPYMFLTSWTSDQMHEGGAKIANDRGVKRVYLLAPNYQAGKDALAGFKRAFKGEVVEEVYTQTNQPDYSVEISQIQLAKPDAVYVFYPGSMGVNFIKQYRQAGMADKIPLLSSATVDGSTLPALRQDALGTITNAPYAPDVDNPQNHQFAAAYEKRFGRPASFYAAQSYDAANLLASVIKKLDGKFGDKEAVRAAIKAADFQSVRGPFSFNTNQFPIANFYRVEVVKDAKGNAVLSAKGVNMENSKDAFYEQCPMK